MILIKGNIGIMILIDKGNLILGSKEAMINPYIMGSLPSRLLPPPSLRDTGLPSSYSLLVVE